MESKRGYSWEIAKSMLAKHLRCTERAAEELMEGMEREFERKEKASCE